MSTRMLNGRYEIEKPLSRTAFSTVYLACDRRHLHRPACIITAIRYRQRGMRDRLAHEAQTLMQLGQFPQVPSVIEYFSLAADASSTEPSLTEPSSAEPYLADSFLADSSLADSSNHQPSSPSGSVFYLVQEQILGHPLSRELTAGKKLSESYVSKLLQDTLVALAAVHRQGEVHQNLHPQNILRQDFDGQIFLTEFGTLSRLSRSEITPDGSLRVSSPVSPQPYLAPEQLQPDYTERPQPASDLYALGLIALEALIGRPYYNLPYDPSRRLLWREGITVSLPIAEFIDRLIRHEWQDRFADAADALDALRLECDRYKIAHDSSFATVIAAPGRKSPTLTTTAGRYQPSSHQRRTTGQTAFSTTSSPYSAKPFNPYLFKAFAGGLAVLLALGVGVKTYQWGQYRLSQFPETWQDWRASDSSAEAQLTAKAEAKPEELAALLKDGSILLRPTAVDAFWEMVAAAQADNVGLYALAGYRSSTDEATDTPMTAENNYPSGYAIAIGGTDEAHDWQPSFAQTEAFKWLQANAKNHGFELSVREKRFLGSSSPEPWHWHYTEQATEEKTTKEETTKDDAADSTQS
ncbi:MAG: D-alanyl-D-alanine carboxypeptidase family protein [Phormidesmis sp.]